MEKCCIQAVSNNCNRSSFVRKQTAVYIRKIFQFIQEVGALYPDCSLADLYDPVTMPEELSRAVCSIRAFCFSVGDGHGKVL